MKALCFIEALVLLSVILTIRSGLGNGLDGIGFGTSQKIIAQSFSASWREVSPNCWRILRSMSVGGEEYSALSE